MDVSLYEKQQIAALRRAGFSWDEIGASIGKSAEAARTQWRMMAGTLMEHAYLSVSPYPVYNEPLRMEGDAVIIPDIELPFHDADFVNRVLELAQAWNIRQCIFAGDVLHFASLSKWGADWRARQPNGGLSDAQEAKLVRFLRQLPKKYQDAGFDIVAEMGEAAAGDGVSAEIDVARRELEKFSQLFDRIDYVLGNHDARYLLALNSPMFAGDLLRNLALPEPKWRIAPYYFSELVSNGELFRIEHPKSAAKSTAYKLASKYHCHILMAHSHKWSHEFDISGKYHAIQMGHCVDERRLPYASQRSTTADAHTLGAVIVRDGWPWLLTPTTSCEQLARLTGNKIN